MKTDLILAAAVAALPWLTMNSATEPKRLLFLAAVYVAALAARRFKPLLQGAAGLTMLAIGWFESFPAWNHSAEIGTYVLCGTAVVALASYRAARRPQFAQA